MPNKKMVSFASLSENEPGAGLPALARFQPKWMPVRRGKRVKAETWSLFTFPGNMKQL
jgi:hypothetical protein